MIVSSENRALAGAMAVPACNIGSGTKYPAFLSDAQKERLDRIALNRMLFDGCHREYFLDGGRSAFTFPVERMGVVLRPFYLTFNVLGLVAIKGGDLLFGQAPAIECDNQLQWDALQGLIRRTQLHPLLLDAAACANAEGEAMLEALVHTDGQVYVNLLDNAEVFPVGEEGGVGPDGQYSSYVRYLLKNVGTAESPIWLLLETTSTAGTIARACWQLDKDKRKEKQLELAVWDPTLKGQDQTATGIHANTIVWVPNLRARAVSDFDCALCQQDTLNAKNTQIARVIGKHSSPRLALPRAMGDSQGNVAALAELFYFDDINQVPKYITWDANLAVAVADRAAALNQLLVRTEMSPVLLGLKEGAAPESYRKVRLEAFNSLAKAARKSLIWTACVQKVLDVAMALECTRPGQGFTIEPVGVTLRDGIPVDDGEQATTIATLRAAQVMSRRRAVSMQLGDEAAVDAELAELDREASQATPSVLFGETTATQTGTEAQRHEGTEGQGDATTTAGGAG